MPVQDADNLLQSSDISLSESNGNGDEVSSCVKSASSAPSSASIQTGEKETKVSRPGKLEVHEEKETKVSRPMKLEVHVDKRKKRGCNNDHVLEVVRGKEERAKLEGHTCIYCENYYKGLKCSDEEKERRIQQCSRHRGTVGAVARSSTPPGFWDHNMPSTPEAIERGMMTVASGPHELLKTPTGNESDESVTKKRDEKKRVGRKRRSEDFGASSLPSSGGLTSVSSRKAKRVSIEDEEW